MNYYTALAKKTAENYIKNKEIIDVPKDLPSEMIEKKAGTFVTVLKEENLRGCIGTYAPTKENIAKEIIDNTISAVSKDYRFGPIKEEELPYLSYSVYVLGELEKIENIKDLNPKKFGILIKSNSKSGLLLPDLEGIDTLEKQILAVCQKAGINPENEKISIYRFSAKKHEE